MDSHPDPQYPCRFAADQCAQRPGKLLCMASAQTVLVVEDDEAILESIVYQLGRAGYRVLRATDGAQGLRLFQSQRPDLVILDLMLPALDGWRFTEQVRAEDPRVPVIVCSARTSEFDRVTASNSGPTTTSPSRSR